MKILCSRCQVLCGVARLLNLDFFSRIRSRPAQGQNPPCERITPSLETAASTTQGLRNLSALFLTRLLLAGMLLLFAVHAAAVTNNVRYISGSLTPVAINERGWIAGQSLYSPYGAALFAGRVRTVTPGTAYGLNDNGVIVGEYVAPDSDNKSRAFRASPAVSTDVVSLGVLAGGNASAAYAINRAGKAVGYSNMRASAESASLVDHAVLFRDGKVIDLGYFAEYGGIGAYARGINDADVIVGAFKKTDGTYRPFQIIDGTVVLLNGFELDNAQAIGINNNGCIIGNITLSDGSTRAFLYERGQRTDIVPEGGGPTRIYGQNDLGQFVGEYKVTNSAGTLETRAFVFDNGVFMELQSLLPTTFTQMFTVAYAINNRGAIVARTSSGVYVVSPRTISPMIQHPALPLPRLPVAGDGFGASIAVAGNLAVVGAPGEQGNRGAAYVFHFDGKLWREEARLVATDSVAGHRLGERVAIDGDTVVVTTTARTAAYVFRRSGVTWNEIAQLVPGTTGGTNFGASVAMSGTRIVIGAPYEGVTVESVARGYAGAIYVFDWDGTQWTRTRLTAPEPLGGGMFGSAVAVNGDVVAAGEPSPCTGYCYCYYCTAWRGRAYVYTYESGAWRTQSLIHANIGYLDGFGSSMDMTADTLVVAGSSTASIYKRADAATGTEWIEQDWISIDPGASWTNQRIAIEGDEIAVGATESTSASYVRIYRRVGRVWDDAQRVDPATALAANALVYHGTMLMFASATGAGTVVPMTICPESPCAETAVADLSVALDAPATALVAESVTHTVAVTNRHPEHTARYVAIRSQFSVSSGAALNWLGVPSGCVAAPTLGRVDCVVRDLGPGQQVHLDLHLAAPSLSGTLKHDVVVQHVGSDPTPTNNNASAEMTITSDGKPRIEVYAPHQDAIVTLSPGQKFELAYDILNFDLGEVGNVFTLIVDSGEKYIDTTQQPIILEFTQQGSHRLTFELSNSASALHVVKTVDFYVEIEKPDVVVEYPSNGSTVYCRSGDPVLAQVALRYWPLGEGSRELQARIDGSALSGPVATVVALQAIDLCALEMDTAHSLSIALRYGNTGDIADSDSVTFDLRKAMPNLDILEPVEGNTGYARGGFAMIYEFERGYDAAQVTATLNGTPLTGLFEMSKTNSFPLPQDLLRDGSNELIVTVTADGKQTQVSTVRFYTKAASPDAATSKGGVIDLFALALLSLLGVIRARHVPGSRITPMRVALSRPRSR